MSKRPGRLVLALAGLLLADVCTAAMIGTCTDGLRATIDFYTNVNGVINNPPQARSCSPWTSSRVDAAEGLAAVGVAAAGVGASAGAGASASSGSRVTSSISQAQVELEFMVASQTSGPVPSVDQLRRQ